jgi:purine-nucleoside phosphorylase
MLVKDHINMFSLAAESPLRGPNDESFGPRFFSINDLYNKKWRNIAKAAAEEARQDKFDKFLTPLLSAGWHRPHCA